MARKKKAKTPKKTADGLPEAPTTPDPEDTTVSDAIDGVRPNDSAPEDEPAAPRKSPTGLPLYGCMLPVEAFRIIDTESLTIGHVRLIGEDCERVVNAAYVDKHRPQAGQYFVRYHSGKLDCVAAAEFEANYVRVK